ncbi:RluA family pseudouridine synthase [Acetilactobacillus jinshanensis]|uniref:Pseudouridine synthase n=1 Tax=Acetilactobacillus jinshanensis TaxID=1720083 RepID=A0A4P6ZM13_9LACO|nr:RluA family pseudouridine synthase [Acetilactobacillus jinshanensis]QBP18921.1 RluA family pseudouridine synthase [Acetilactobacillus jinshanensis]URL60529.1 RluA family pseudouridine synthase [uncultured bacterium]
MKWQYHLRVPAEITPCSVRHYLSKYLLIPRYKIYRLRKHQRVLVNHKYLPMNYQINAGDHVDLTFLPSDFREPFPNVDPDSAANVKIAYEDRDLLVVNKQRGDKTHPNQPGEIGTTLNHVAAYLQPKHEQPYIVHRLDQQTSGALIIAKNPAVVPILVRLISEKRIKRTYLAWCQGIFKKPSGIINQPIGYDPKDQRKRKINGLHAKRAITKYHVIKTKGNRSLVKINLMTGRTHQIRVHMASLGHPIIGDPLYNPETQLYDPMLLHSWQLKLIQPFYMNVVHVTTPLPNDFKI